jgi:hypothetical protein
MQMEMPAMGRIGECGSPVASIMFSDEKKTCLAKKNHFCKGDAKMGIGMGWGSDPSTEITMNWIWIPWILCEIKTTSRSLREWADNKREFLRTSSQLWKFFSLHKAYEMPVRSCTHHLHFDHRACEFQQQMEVRSSNVTFEDNVRELMDPATEHARNHTASVSVPSGL